jgi:hypothetical protein
MLLLSLSIRAEETHMEIIPLKHRPVEMILPTLKKMADDNVLISSANDQIILKGSAAKLAELHFLIDELDTPLTQLLISIRHGESLQQQGNLIAYEGAPKFNSGKTTLSIGSTFRSTSTEKSKTTVRNKSTTTNNNITQQVRATEGLPAYIETGSKTPINFVSRHHNNAGNPDHIESHPIMTDIVTGFYVTPLLLSGDNILLSLSTKKQSLNNQRHINSDTYEGTVTGRLDQWILIGGKSQKQQKNHSALIKRYSSQLSSNDSVYLKVERATQ